MSDPNAIETHRRALRMQQARGEAVRRLMDNQDFKELILEGFLRDEAAQTAIASVHPAKHVREIAQLRLAGYGVLDSYLTETINLARQAEDALASDENLMDYVSTPGI